MDYDKIKRLQEIAKRTIEEKREAEELEKARTARQRLIDGEPEIVREMHFYCSKHGDFISNGHKVVQKDWNSPGQNIAFYRAFGFASFVTTDGRAKPGKACNHAIRYLTDKHLDPFYKDSKMLRKLRIEMADDLLQPGDPRFEAKYGNPYKEHYKQLEAKERAEWEQNNKR